MVCLKEENKIFENVDGALPRLQAQFYEHNMNKLMVCSQKSL